MWFNMNSIKLSMSPKLKKKNIFYGNNIIRVIYTLIVEFFMIIIQCNFKIERIIDYFIIIMIIL